MPTSVALDPRLTRDRLDDVVAVEGLQRLEEVERAAEQPVPRMLMSTTVKPMTLATVAMPLVRPLGSA